MMKMPRKRHITRGCSQSAIKRPLADPVVEPVEKAPKISPIMVVFTEEKMMRKA
jgi:hypothetical protein